MSPADGARARMAERLRQVPLATLRFVVLDTETTGLGEAHLVEVAAVGLGPGARREVFETLVDPGRPIPRAASAIHGITDAMVVGAPRPRAALCRLLRFMRGAVPVAHHASFDVKVLAAELFRAALPLPRLWVLDSLRLTRRLFPGLPCYRLEALGHELQLDCRPGHRALADALATAELLARCLARLGEQASLLDLVEANGRPYSFERAIAASNVIHGELRRQRWRLVPHPGSG